MATRSYSRKPKEQQSIAKERIEKLFVQADKIFPEDPSLADKYVKLARKIGMKYKVRIRPLLQKKFCKHCYCYLRQGVNCRVRLQDKKVVYYCHNCKKFMRFPYSKKKIKKT